MSPSPASARLSQGDEHAAQVGPRGGAHLGRARPPTLSTAPVTEISPVHGPRPEATGSPEMAERMATSHGQARRGAVHKRPAGEVDVYIIALHGHAQAGKRRARGLGGVRAPCPRAAAGRP